MSEMASLLARPLPSTVAGAAQVGTALRRRPSCFPLNCVPEQEREHQRRWIVEEQRAAKRVGYIDSGATCLRAARERSERVVGKGEVIT